MTGRGSNDNKHHISANSSTSNKPVLPSVQVRKRVNRASG
jgi:hypothetical protein